MACGAAMRNLSPRFNAAAAASNPAKTAHPAPFSLRLTQDERARLDQLRGSKSLGAHIRERLFGEDAEPRKRDGKGAVQDAEALGRVLGALGQSRLSSNLNQLAKAVNSGSLPVSPETESDIVEACRDIAAIRADLLRALGKSPGDGP